LQLGVEIKHIEAKYGFLKQKEGLSLRMENFITWQFIYYFNSLIHYTIKKMGKGFKEYHLYSETHILW